MKTLLIAKSAVEIGAGLAFALFPSAVFFLLFGEHSDSRLLIRAGYIIGIALVTLGIACWLSRNDSRSHAASGLIVALLIYDLFTMQASFSFWFPHISAPAFRGCSYGRLQRFIRGSPFAQCFVSKRSCRRHALDETHFVRFAIPWGQNRSTL